jgi:hypothetical protein
MQCRKQVILPLRKKMSRLKDFQDWRENAKPTLEKLGYSVSFFDSPKSLNRSARIDFKGNTLEATIMVWEHGNVVAEAFSFITKEFILMEEINEDITPLKKVLNVHLENIIKHNDGNIEL